MPCIEDQVIALYARGVSIRDIQDHRHRDLRNGDLTDAGFQPDQPVAAPHPGMAESTPVVRVRGHLFLDAIHYKVRQDGHVETKAAYMVVGIGPEGQKDVLGMWIGGNEPAKFWLRVLTELKARCVQDVHVLHGQSEGIQ